MSHSRTFVNLTALALAAGALTAAACGGEDAPPASPAVDTTRSAAVNVRARPCRDDALFIDVPMRSTPSWTTTAFLPALEASLASQANSNGKFWFCGFDQVTCPAGAAVIDVSPVLPQRTTPAWRTDGHLRFFRVTFLDAATGARLKLRPSSRCDAVSATRSAFAFHAGATFGTAFVGRECDGLAQSVASQATPEMLSWHLPAIGLDAADVDIDALAPIFQRVNLGLVDTGVMASVAASSDLGLAGQIDYVNDGVEHPHGTAMAILERQVAPAARLLSSRALGGGGGGVSGDLARAIDDAVFSDTTRPLVMNLSLGWPQELGNPAVLSDSDACVTYEDPFGEAVRYTLDVARRIDDSGTRRVFVVSAAGNQPLPVEPGVFPEPPAGMATPVCPTPTSPGVVPWFFPAQWQYVNTCRTASDSGRVSFGVSAIDDRNLQAGNAIPDAESPLVAPGQHVYVAHAAATPPLTAPMCGANAGGLAPSLPMSLSGSSVSAALVSAAAARAQTRRIAMNQPPLSWNVLARMLYLSGRSLCRTTDKDNLMVRRLDVDRLMQSLSRRDCVPLVNCATNLAGTETIPADILQSCRFQLALCGLESVNRFGQLVEDCVEQPQASVPWPTGYAASAPICSAAVGGALQDVASCGALGCPYEEEPNRVLLGSLGPQPNAGGCLDCSIVVDVSAGSAMLTAEIEPTLPVGTTLTKVYVLIQGKDTSGADVAKYFAVDQNNNPWKPGGSYAVSVSLSNLDIVWWTASSSMISLMSVPNQAPANDVSPLRLEVE